MNGFISLPANQRRSLCIESETKCGLPSASIEKDFWVCWTLRELFSLPEWGDSLTFKGGTSLSKGWNLIERFSEDIDIVIDKGFLGFGSENSPEEAPSKKKLKVRLQEMKEAGRHKIHAELRPALGTRFAEILPESERWRLESADVEEDPDEQTLLFFYPETLVESGAYVRPVVKIEMGARSDNEPVEEPVIHPYLFETFPGIIGPSQFSVRALAPERTFWEKAMLLHEEACRPAEKRKLSVRMARHYYDLWCLITKGVAERAVKREDIFTRTAQHREIYFRWSWMDYLTLKRGQLRLCPRADQEADWRSDYQAMQTTMFFGQAPDFDDILQVVSEFERNFNAG